MVLRMCVCCTVSLLQSPRKIFLGILGSVAHGGSPSYIHERLTAILEEEGAARKEQKGGKVWRRIETP